MPVMVLVVVPVVVPVAGTPAMVLPAQRVPSGTVSPRITREAAPMDAPAPTVVPGSAMLCGP